MNKNKRDVLKGLAVGSVWAAPVVSSVILPAHAKTSDVIVPPSLCPVEITYDLNGTSHATCYVYDVYDGEVIDEDRSDGPGSYNETDILNLAPGTYSLGLSYHAVGGTGSVTVACCDSSQTTETEERNDAWEVMIVVGTDGTCEVSIPD